MNKILDELVSVPVTKVVSNAKVLSNISMVLEQLQRGMVNFPALPMSAVRPKGPPIGRVTSWTPVNRPGEDLLIKEAINRKLRVFDMETDEFRVNGGGDAITATPTRRCSSRKAHVQWKRRQRRRRLRRTSVVLKALGPVQNPRPTFLTTKPRSVGQQHVLRQKAKSAGYGTWYGLTPDGSWVPDETPNS